MKLLLFLGVLYFLVCVLIVIGRAVKGVLGRRGK